MRNRIVTDQPRHAEQSPFIGDAHMKSKDLTQDGIKNSARGKKNVVKGRVEDALGGLTGDTGLQLKGKLNQAKGKVQDAVGKVERKIERTINRNS
jgi:uncharacterized protein YjbJ (UPF0337 family)